MRVLLERALVIILLALLGLLAADWLVYRIRFARGSAFDTVKINAFMAVPLKNGKEELDYVSSQQVTCVRSMFPWAGDRPCWWVRRHTEKRIAM